MPRIKFGWEMAKFGIYIMFPIGVLALWGHSELYDLIPTSQDEIKHYKKLAEENTNKIPKTPEEIKEKIELMKRNYARMQAEKEKQTSAAPSSSSSL